MSSRIPSLWSLIKGPPWAIDRCFNWTTTNQNTYKQNLWRINVAYNSRKSLVNHWVPFANELPEFLRNCVEHVHLRTCLSYSDDLFNSLKVPFSPSILAKFEGSRNYETASNQIHTSVRKHGSKETAFSMTLTGGVPNWLIMLIFKQKPRTFDLHDVNCHESPSTILWSTFNSWAG